MSHDQSPEASGHETRDVRIRPIVWGGIILVGLSLVAFAVSFVTMQVDRERAGATSLPQNPLELSIGRQEPPAPRLQLQPLRDIRDLRAANDALLAHYAWVDKSAGVVRIPIERAMELLAQRGLPARTEGAAGAHE